MSEQAKECYKFETGTVQSVSEHAGVLTVALNTTPNTFVYDGCFVSSALALCIESKQTQIGITIYYVDRNVPTAIKFAFPGCNLPEACPDQHGTHGTRPC